MTAAFTAEPFFFFQLSDPQFGMFTDNKDFAQETANFEFAVATINRRALADLPGQEASALAEVDGDFGGRSFPADEELRLKVGAHVMMLRNDADGRWVIGVQRAPDHVVLRGKTSF